MLFLKRFQIYNGLNSSNKKTLKSSESNLSVLQVADMFMEWLLFVFPKQIQGAFSTEDFSRVLRQKFHFSTSHFRHSYPVLRSLVT